MAEISRLGRYELRRILGRGAMGVVYEGFDPNLSRRVAVKTILKSVALDPETERAYSGRFIQEAKAVARLNHPNIVQVYDFGVEGEVAYLVMEFIEGRELRSFFEANEKFAPEEAVRIMTELLDALDFAHEAGVIHRDVKPANVMLDAQRRAKLADFGVARIQDSDRSMGGTMVGTPAFMSPEQIQGQKVDRRTDIFSAGNILYQLLTAEQPFKGEGAWTVAKRIVEVDPPPPSGVTGSVSPSFDRIIAKALAKKPADRFASAKDFSRELRAALAPVAQPTASSGTKQLVKAETKASETELEFWRSIQNRDDLDELELYVEQFPNGAYVQLARLKIAKLREPLEAARRLAEEKDKEKQEAAVRAKRDAEEQARREAEERARREAEQRAKREAEERARLQAEERERRAAEEKAKREAAEQARRAAEEKARREREAQALARLKQQEAAAARAKRAVDTETTVAIPSERNAAIPPGNARKSIAIPIIVAAAVVSGGIGAYLYLGRTPAPVPVAQAPSAKVAAAPPAAPAVDLEKLRRETEERLRKEFADKAAAERAALEKAVADKAAAEKAAAEKIVLAKTASEKAAAEKTAEKAAFERAAAEKAAAEKAASARAAAEKAAQEKIATEKAASDKAAAEKAAAAKAAAAAVKPGWPSPGDRWVYEVRLANWPDKKYEAVFEAKAVSPGAITESFRAPGYDGVDLRHGPGASLVGLTPGVALFSPFIRAFQELRGGERWTNVDYRQFWNCSTNTNVSCSASAQVAGREKVSVKAGSFDAWKIEVELRQRALGWPQTAGGTGPVYFTYWFADGAKRFVKMRSRIQDYWLQPAIEMELVSYVPAVAR